MKRRLWLTRLRPGLLALAAVVATAMPASAVTYDLVAKAFTTTMPGNVSVNMWGFAQDTGQPCEETPGWSVGPKLAVNPGDGLTVNLRNCLAVPVSIVIPGQALPDGSAPVRQSSGRFAGRVRSFTHETPANGGTAVYSWSALKPGTHLYHSGTHPQVQVQMGLYGSVSKDSAAGQAYPGVPYTQQLDLVFSEIDPALHQAVADGTYGAAPGPTSTLDYHPKYFLINGEPFSTGAPCIGDFQLGDSVLLRLYNTGLRELAPTMLGSHFQAVAEGGSRYPFRQERYSVLLQPGSTKDLLFQATRSGRFPIVDRRLNLTNATAPDGGMQTCLGVGGAPPGTEDVIFADSFESRSFTAWSGVRNREHDLSVTAAAALAGSFGMAALIDNNTTMWVQTDTPNNEPRYRARFYLDPNSIPMSEGNALFVMAARSGKLTAGSDVVRVEFRRWNNRYNVRAAIARDAGTFVNTEWYVIPNGPTAIEIDWQAATAPSANNGALSLWTAGTLRQTVSGIDNDTLRVNSARLGAVQGIDTGTRGTVYFDGFVSRRSTFIGP